MIWTRLRRGFAVAAVTTAAVALSSVGLAVPAQAASGINVWEMDGADGDWVSGGQDYSLSGADATFQVSSRGDGLEVHVNGSTWWFALIAPPEGEQLAVGTYSVAARASGPGTAGIDVGGDGRSCNQTVGSFTIYELERGPVDPASPDVPGQPTRLSMSYTQSCEGFMPALTGVIAVNATVVPALASKMTLTAPASVAPTAAVHLTGTLAGSAGPLDGRTVSVSRTDASGTTDLGTVVTDTAGAFAVDDTAGTSDATYMASFAGADDYRPSTASKVVKVVKITPILTIGGPKSAVKRNSSQVIHGRLSAQSVAIGGASLTLTRKDLAGTKTLHVTTAADGTWTTTDVNHVGGTVSWKVSWAGDGARAAASAATTMSVTRATTSIAMSVNHTTVGYKGYVTLSVHLGKTYNGHTVTFAKDVAADGKSYVNIITKKVSSKGNVTLKVRAGANTTFRARFVGDYHYGSVSSARSVHVLTHVGLSMSGYTYTSGGYYHYAGNPLMTVGVAPTRAGGCAHMTVQVYSGGTWRTVATMSCLTLDGSSRGYAEFVNSHPVGVRYRVHASVGSNARSVASSSPWRYFTYG